MGRNCFSLFKDQLRSPDLLPNTAQLSDYLSTTLKEARKFILLRGWVKESGLGAPGTAEDRGIMWQFP